MRVKWRSWQVADQATDKNNIGNHLAHDFVGSSQGFTTCISDGRETVMEHHTGVKKTKYLKKAEQLKKLQRQWILENTSAKENAM